MRGFSLVELSIVLVILGLLTGGILTGQSLIRASELRSVTTDFQKYESAIYTFRDKYFGLPGDLRNATSFWGALDTNDGIGTDCTDATTTSALTCNGDGNGVIYGLSTLNESFHAWVHLANAGLVEGSYSGKRTADPNEATPGINIPKSKVGQAGYLLLMADLVGPTNGWYTYVRTTILQFGTRVATFDNGGAALKPEEAWNIDTKLDDGKPGTGKVMARYGNNCTSPGDGTLQSTATYALTVSTIGCAMTYAILK